MYGLFLEGVIFITQSIKLKIGPLGCVVEETKENGESSDVKVLMLSALTDIFKTDKLVTTPFLPLNCRHYLRKHSTQILALEFPPSIYRVQYNLEQRHRNEDDDYDLDEYDIPTPYLLYVAVLGCGDNNNSFVRADYLFALSKALESFDDTLYSCPFGNVDRDNRICWGDIVRGESPHLIFLSTAMDRFIGSVFNADLDDSEKWSRNPFNYKGDRKGTLELFELLDGKETFPPEALVSSRYETYQKMLDVMLGRYTI